LYIFSASQKALFKESFDLIVLKTILSENISWIRNLGGKEKSLPKIKKAKVTFLPFSIPQIESWKRERKKRKKSEKKEKEEEKRKKDGESFS
jgi:long-subunit acyl-CoA synthetase (AMP-forming)